jgi:hypothetical protein
MSRSNLNDPNTPPKGRNPLTGALSDDTEGSETVHIDTEQAYPTLSERVALTGASVTLDERPARITGYRREFATVTDRADPARSAEWAWPTVARIVARGGEFAS